MMTRLRKAWESRAPRERTIIAILALALVIILYLWLVLSGGGQHRRLHASMDTLRSQAVRLEQEAAELERLRAAPSIAISPTDLLTLVQAQAGSARLASSLVKLEARDADQVVVGFGAVAFTDWLNWIASLETQHIRLDSCRIESLPAPGMVSVTATLLRPRHQ